MYIRQKTCLAAHAVKSLAVLCVDEIRRGTFRRNFPGMLRLDFGKDMSWAELLLEKRNKTPEKTFIIHGDRRYTYRDMDERANRVARYFADHGLRQGAGVAMIMGNSPRFLDVFFAIQVLGMYAVPVNTSLRGDSLLYILEHCDAGSIVVDRDHADELGRIRDRLKGDWRIFINNDGAPSGSGADHRYINLDNAYAPPPGPLPAKHNERDICFILYTSGTTGLPKGVVYRYGNTGVKRLSFLARWLFQKDDIFYTCLPLFHANALFLTMTCAMHSGATVVLAKRFSAGRFWNEIRSYGITTFNTIGAMIPILIKQPEGPDDRQNTVRFTLSAACPANQWELFENRFGMKIYEGYGAVDGGGKSIFNLGTAPVGSIGKPGGGAVYRIVDREMNNVPDGVPGELIFRTSGNASPVEYYKDEKATGKKVSGGWIFTGDLVKRDAKGFLYFIGRNTESMRIKGENVSAFEVEQAIQKHPSVLEAAVYAVPSELAEDEVMASISLVDGASIRERDLIEFLRENLPRFAVPRYIRIVREFPKTETMRIRKKELEKAGIAAGTFDCRHGDYIRS